MSSFHVPTIVSFTEKATSLTELQQAHAQLLKTGLFNDPYTASRLVAFAYTNPNLETISYAHSVFTHINKPTPFPWNCMIRAYANSSTPQNGLAVFSQMLETSVVPDNYTYPFVIKACSAFGGLHVGRQVHAHVAKTWEMSEDKYVQNSLVWMYASCGCFDVARNLLDNMSHRDVVSWNAVLRAYTEKGLMESAVGFFDEMEERNVDSWNFMVSGFAKAGLIEEARRMFDEIPLKDVVSWNAIISGYADVGDFAEVLNLFKNMLREDIKPDSCILVNVLSACANLRALSEGKWIHSYINENAISVHGFLGSALVNLYSNCGEIEKALNVFNNTLEKDASTWNSMIRGLNINGLDEEAVGMFRRMLKEGHKPNEISFTTALSACSLGGFLIDGLKIMNIMIHDYATQPTIEHYGLVVNLLGQAGLLEEAKEFLKGETSGQEPPVLWQSLLSSCMNYSNLELAQDAAEKSLKLDSRVSAQHAQLSNIYATKGKRESVAEMIWNL